MTREESPQVVVLSGPNGAGKSTVAGRVIHEAMGLTNFVNADTIARGLCAFNPESVAVEAGRLMLNRLHQLASAREDFAFETTLASRTFAPWLERLIAAGYEFHLVFMFLPDADTAVARVAERVRLGGHHVPEEVVRRRYNRGIRNFFALYQPIAANWQVLLSAPAVESPIIAYGQGKNVHGVGREGFWNQMRRSAGLDRTKETEPQGLL